MMVPDAGSMVSADRSSTSCPQAAYGKCAALAGTLCPVAAFGQFTGKFTEQKVLQHDPPVGFCIVFRGKSMYRLLDPKAEGGWCRKGIPLYMVDGQDVSRETVTALQCLIGGVGPVVILIPEVVPDFA